MNQLDTLADRLRMKDAEQRGNTSPVPWRFLTQIDRTKWRELALVAVVELSRPDGSGGEAA